MSDVDTIVLVNGTDEQEFPVADSIARQRLDTAEKNYKVLKAQVSNNEKELQSIGTLASLKTNAKGSLVEAINEIIDRINASNG